MSQQNVDVIRRAYDAFARQDIPAVLGAFDDTIEWTTPDSLPIGGTVRGHKGVTGFFQSLPEYFQELRVQPEQFIDGGDQVIVLGRHVGRGARGQFDVPWCMVWTMRNGKVTRFQEFNDTAKITQAIAA
jgi:ketosteroid isomerase-like protein